MKVVVKTVLQILGKNVSNELTQKEIKSSIDLMRSEMKDALGQQALDEISRQLVEKISGIEEVFKENFL